jgi:hypothetical protein
MRRHGNMYHSFFKFELVESVSESIVKINLESLSSYGHRYKALCIKTELKPIFTRGFSNALEGLGTCSTRNKVHRTAKTGSCKALEWYHFDTQDS